MTKEWLAEIVNWEKEYPTLKGVTLNKREKELLDGAEIKSHEGMVFGRMKLLKSSKLVTKTTLLLETFGL